MAKHNYCVVAIVLLLLLSLQCSAKRESILIIVLPQSDSEVSASWERGEEIRPGAVAAIEEANNDSLSFNVSLVEATSGPVSRYDLPYSGNVLEIIANLTWQDRASDIIGIAGVLHPNILAATRRFQLPIISLIHFDNTPGLYISSSVQYMTASTSVLTDSILTFMKEMQPRKIKIITEIKQPYWKVSRQLSTKANISLDTEIINEHQTLLSDIANRVYASNTHIVLLSVGPSTAVPMLCEAYKIGLTWPDYAWMLHSYRFEDLLNSLSYNEECTAQKILEGVFIFQLTEEQNDLDSETMQGNPYADLLHDSVRALISSVDNSSSAYSNESFSTPYFSPGSSQVYIYHNLNGTVSLTGTYDGTSHTLTKFNASEIFTDYDLPQMYIPILSLYILPLPILSFLFNTVLLVLYIVFRKEKSVKSTSVSLSMLLFTGCYLMAIFVILDILFDVYRIDQCMLLYALSTLGLSMPLIFAVLLLKMLRVYRIFTVIKLPGKSRKYKDYALLFYTVLLLLPQVTLLIIRTAVDPSHRVETPIEQPGVIMIVGFCISEHWQIWYWILFPYYWTLQGALIFVAIKTRKIRSKNFKDTKKVNLLMFLILMIGVCGIAYLVTFFTVGLYYYTAIIIIVIQTLIPTACQFTLFVPKIWPPLQKKASCKPCSDIFFQKRKFASSLIT